MAELTHRIVTLDEVRVHAVEADDDHGRDDALANQAVGGFVDLPVDSGEGRRRLEQVLTVIEVERGIAPTRVGWIVVSRRQPDAKKARVAEDAAAEFVQA